MTKLLQLSIVCLLATSAAWAAEPASNAIRRGDFANSQSVFEKTGAGRVAFIGGSITEMNGYRPMVSEWIAKKFPKTEFDFVNAGISSTCSTTGSFRLNRDVFQNKPVDLLFIEFAVNDDQDAMHARRQCIRGMEGIIRHVRRDHPRTDIVVTYFVNPGMLALLQAGKTPTSIAAHESVAEHYNVSTIWLAREVAERTKAGDLTWAVYGGTHPKPAGNRIAADMIAGMLGDAWKGTQVNKAVDPHPFRIEMIDQGSYDNGELVDVAEAKIESGWKVHVPDWKSLPGGKRDRFTSMKMLCATEAGAELTFDFTGNAVGAFVSAGPDAGQVEAQIDDGKFQTFDLYHHYSKGLHYPRTVMFGADLGHGPHTLRLRMKAPSSDRPAGTSARIMAFGVNQTVAKKGDNGN